LAEFVHKSRQLPYCEKEMATARPVRNKS